MYNKESLFVYVYWGQADMIVDLLVGINSMLYDDIHLAETTKALNIYMTWVKCEAFICGVLHWRIKDTYRISLVRMH